VQYNYLPPPKGSKNTIIGPHQKQKKGEKIKNMANKKNTIIGPHQKGKKIQLLAPTKTEN